MSDELLNEFIFDSREHLSTAGAQLLDLEKDPASTAALNALMGTMHTIKGNSGFLDLRNLYQLVHHAESLLQTVREKRRCCSQKQIDLLLQVLDTVEALLDRLENGDNDQADWLEALNLALSEAESALEGGPQTASQTDPAAPAGGQAQAVPGPAVAPKIVFKDDLSGKINLLALKDGQLTQEAEIIPAKVEAMFQAGLRGLVLDLRNLVNVSSRDLKVLMTVGRQDPDHTAYLLDMKAQESLYRVFRILNLDRFMRFFPDKEPALTFIKQNGEGTAKLRLGQAD